MQGSVFLEFKHYLQLHHPSIVWKELLVDGGLAEKKYIAYESYPAKEFFLMVSIIGRKLGKTNSELIEDFGKFVAPKFLRASRPIINKNWTLLDLIEHTQGAVNDKLKLALRGDFDFVMKCVRSGPNEVHMIYITSGEMCDFAKGLIKGLAAAYQTPIVITEKACVHRGEPYCEIIVQTVPVKTFEKNLT